MAKSELVREMPDEMPAYDKAFVIVAVLAGVTLFFQNVITYEPSSLVAE
jgi:hypothetical protein